MSAEGVSLLPVHPALLFVEFALRLLVAGLVLVRKGRRPAVAMAWLVAVLGLPVMGIAAYLLVGENRFGTRRARRHRDILGRIDTPQVHAHADPRCTATALPSDQAQPPGLAEVSH